MCTLISRWFGGSRRRARAATIGWWEYFGSFGDDIFDEDPEPVS